MARDNELVEIIIKKGEGYLRRQSEWSKKERGMDCDGGAAEDGGDGEQRTKDARLQ